MIEPYVSFLLGRIGTVMDDEIRFLRGVKGKISGANTELMLISAFLRDADDSVSRGGNNQVRACVATIREAAWELEDVLTLLSERRRRQRWLGGLSGYRNAGQRLETVTEQLSKCRAVLLENRVLQAPLREPGQLYLSSHQVELRRSLPDEGGGYIFVPNSALSNAVELVAAELTGSDHGIVSICGMGGIGKTTLARRVYHHPLVRGSFTRFAWVQISPDFDQNQVWRDILTILQRHQKNADDSAGADVAGMLRETLTLEKCLVVIDDVWPVSTWNRLRQAFPAELKNSRILITTRNKEIHLSLPSMISFLHEPRCLTDSESWDFFAAKANFENITNNLLDRAEMKSLCAEMLQFCSGLPLAIEVLAGILSNKLTVEAWELVHRNVKAFIRRGTIKEQSQYSGVMWLLSLSYEELPYHVKQCFLHLSHFADDGISMKELYQLWMAEELASSEDEACEFFQNLENRYLVQVVEESLTGGVKKYRIHSLIKDMCTTKAREEKFLLIKDFQNKHRGAMDSSTEFGPGKVRRFAIYVDDYTQDELLVIVSETCNYVRSFVCFNSAMNPNLEPVMKPLFEQFRRLRVLKFENQTLGQIGVLPEEIGKLIHLRFLSLRNINVTNLPSSIGKLRQLQTLDLRSNLKVVIPDSMSKLINLRHLYLPQKIEVRGGKSLRPEKLTSLRTLVNIPMELCNVNALSQLGELRKLKLYGWRNDTATVSTFDSLVSLAVNIDKEVDLTRLMSSCPKLVKLYLNLKMETLPNSLLSCRNLKKLTLRRGNLEFDPMQMLQSLPRLMILRFEDDAFLGSHMNCSSTGFCMLKSLYFAKLENFSELVLEDGAFPSLRRLHVIECPSFRTTRPEIQRFINPEELFL